MDYELLVNEAQALTTALDDTKIVPRAVMIAISPETGNWKLWIVPSDDSINKPEFYRIVAECISSRNLRSINAGSVQLLSSNSPAIIGLSMFFNMPGIGSGYISSITYEGILLPDGIIIRMDI